MADPMRDQNSPEEGTTPSVGPLTKAGIARSLAPCLQECDLEALDPTQHSDLLIERVLAYGNRQELRWLFRCYGRARVTEWVRQSGVQRLPWRCATRFADPGALGGGQGVLSPKSGRWASAGLGMGRCEGADALGRQS